MIKIAILGTGRMAQRHADQLKRMDDVEIAACCDIRKEVADTFASTNGIPRVYTDLTTMLNNEDLNAITNVTIDAAHLPTSLEILDKGIHLLCEKPLATNAGDAWKMARAAEEQEKREQKKAHGQASGG